MNYRGYHELIKTIQQNIIIIPRIDLVVGIPRSGMLPASIIALQLNKPLLTFDAFLNSSAPDSGERPINDVLKAHNERLLNVLIVDDSINTGRELQKRKAILTEKGIKHQLFFLCVYAKEENKHIPDLYFELVETPRIFQWNILNHVYLKDCCVDLDGVLCVDPTDEENDDGDKYQNFCLEAKPLYIPSYTIGHIVTSRLEKYRKETELWLDKHDVKYNQLHMMQYSSAEQRRKDNKYGEYKANALIKTDTVMFIESNVQQSLIIHTLTKKPVFCTDNMEFYPNNTILNEYIEQIKLSSAKKTLFRAKQTKLQAYKNWLLFKHHVKVFLINKKLWPK